MAEWKDVVGKQYSEEENYIHSLNFTGGGSYYITKNGMYQIGYIERERKIAIIKANIRLWVMWLRRMLTSK
ncbi:hypothetical protein [Lachnoclostridium phytofermentans]|uniref:Uncharacterized protein n=1 Tax=Lachnoclostridium phytofermentans (strain ATCC 700394 / DSM 18823 / ISDg) TaxID=357809 RepID=A9KQ23_LACP7|nr:hypothetical protein [Lachnoclostridium phytofermentans]ABX43335.1 hypothetical protein Cphy_2978 [Lachnoclostridium phytofermentans ISDg]